MARIWFCSSPSSFYEQFPQPLLDRRILGCVGRMLYETLISEKYRIVKTLVLEFADVGSIAWPFICHTRQ